LTTATDTMLVLPLDKIRPSTDNIRTTVDTDGDAFEGLVTSIASIGLQEPLVVRPTKTAGVYDLTAGHRRYAALRKLGRTECEVIVRTVEGRAGHVVAMLVENLMRKDLTPIEEARAFDRLIEEGKLTQADIASTVGCKQPMISKRLALLKLASRWQNEVHSGGIPIEGALELVKLAGHPARVDAAVKAVREPRYANSRTTWKEAVDEELEDLEIERKIAESTKALADAGTKTIEHPSHGWYSSKAKPLGNSYGEVKVARTKHEKERCHAAAVSPRTGEIVYVCTNPSKHDTTSRSKRDLSPEELKRKESERKRRATQKELKEAAQARRHALVTIVDKKPTKLDERSTFIVRQLIGSLHYAPAELACDLLAVKPTANVSMSKALAAYCDKGPEFVSRAAIAVALAIVDEGMSKEWERWTVVEREHLAYLQRHAGYHLAEVERRKLNDAGLEIPGPKAKTAAVVVDLAAAKPVNGRARKQASAVG
jgi:ParB/RepB/Spo0J family partition protein